MHVADPSKPPANVFMYTLHPARSLMLTEGPTESEKMLAARHWAYSIDLLQRGIVLFAGRTIDRSADSFATVVILATSADEARAIMQNDPAVEGGLFRARLFPYQPMLMGSWPS